MGRWYISSPKATHALNIIFSYPRFCFIFLTIPIWPKYSAISASVVEGLSPEIKIVPLTRNLSNWQGGEGGRVKGKIE